MPVILTADDCAARPGLGNPGAIPPSQFVGSGGNVSFPPMMVDSPTDLMSVFETRPTSAERLIWARSCCDGPGADWPLSIKRERTSGRELSFIVP
jgi:hypothetical protein